MGTLGAPDEVVRGQGNRSNPPASARPRVAISLGLAGRLPTTALGVEAGLFLAFFGVRAVNVVQLSMAFPGSLAAASRPSLDAALAGLFFLESAVLLWFLARAGSVARPALFAMDYTTAVLVLGGQPFYGVGVLSFTEWTTWGFAVSVSAAMLGGMALVRWRVVLAQGAGLAVVYLVTVLPRATTDSGALTTVTNSAAYLAFAALARFGSGYLRRLGRDADGLRQRAVEAARVAEVERHRRLLHDQATILAYFAQDGLDEGMQTALRRQAAVGAAEIRAFMSTEGPAVDASPGALGPALRAAARPFPDLPLTVNVELVDSLVLAPATTAAVARAVATLLHNVRVHADATSSVLHGDHDGASWEVLVRDNGRGFDRESTLLGYGLGEQVVGALAEQSCTATIDARPGEGTTVTLRGPMLSPR